MVRTGLWVGCWGSRLGRSLALASPVDLGPDLALRPGYRSSLDHGGSVCPWAHGVGAAGCPQGPAGGREGSTEEVMGEICPNAAGKGCWSRRVDGPWVGRCSQGA